MRKALSILLAVLVLAAAAWLLWPTVSDQFHRLMSERVISGYASKVSRMSVAQQNVMLAEAREYNQALAAGGVTEEYQAQLDVLDGVMAVLEIPTIGVRLPVYHGTDASGQDLGVEHDPDSSLPVGGSGAHVLLKGPSAVAGAKLLYGLETLREGSLVYLTGMDDTFIYQVQDVSREQPGDFVIRPNEDRVTLVSEHTEDERTIWTTVTALRVGLEDVSALLSHDGVSRVPLVEAALIGAVPFAVLFSFLMLVFRHWRREF